MLHRLGARPAPISHCSFAGTAAVRGLLFVGPLLSVGPLPSVGPAAARSPPPAPELQIEKAS